MDSIASGYKIHYNGQSSYNGKGERKKKKKRKFGIGYRQNSTAVAKDLST